MKKSENQTVVRLKQPIKMEKPFECSDILSRPYLSKEAADVNTACSSSMAGGEVHVSFAASAAFALLRLILALA